MKKKKSLSQSLTIRALLNQEGTSFFSAAAEANDKHSSFVGQQIGKYRLVKLLACGGFSEVYLGEHLHLKTLAAIKILHTQLGVSDVQNFITEARVVARLRHPNIISVLDFDVEDQMPFLVLAYAPNGTLRGRHARREQLSPEVVRSYVEPIAQALHYAHKQQVIHCDVKPENMLIGSQGEILLSDFGIAIVMHTTRNEVQEVLGTISYMSPEQFEGKVLPASDQYSLAVVAYEWLCGRCPFQGSIAEVAGQHIHAAPPSLRQFRAELSPILEAVVLKALAKDPTQRYNSIHDFAQALSEACTTSTDRAYDHGLTSEEPKNEVRKPASTRPLYDVSDLPPTLSAISVNMDQPATITPIVQDVARLPGANSLPSLSAFVQFNPLETNMTRRKMVTRLVGLTVLGTTGGVFFWFWRTRKNDVHPFKQASSGETLGENFSPTHPRPGRDRIIPYRGHTDTVNAIAWLNTGNLVKGYIASASADHTIRIWTSLTGADTRVCSGHTDSVNAVAWSPDGKQIASASSDKTACIWRTSDNSDAVVTYSAHTSSVTSISWSSAKNSINHFIATGSLDQTVHIWRADGSNSGIYRGHSDSVNAVAWSPDDKWIASGSSDMSVHIWSPNDTTDTPAIRYTGHNDSINTVAWSPDSKWIASGSEDGIILVWSATDGNTLVTYKNHSGSINALSWSIDGQFIASASDDSTVQIWQANNGKTLYTYNGHSGNAVRAVAWSPAGTVIASAGDDRSVRVWSAW